MGVAVCNINTLMPHTVGDGNGVEAHVYEQRDMRMSDSVNPDTLYTAGSATSPHFVVQIGFREREKSIIL